MEPWIKLLKNGAITEKEVNLLFYIAQAAAVNAQELFAYLCKDGEFSFPASRMCASAKKQLLNEVNEAATTIEAKLDFGTPWKDSTSYMMWKECLLSTSVQSWVVITSNTDEDELTVYDLTVDQMADRLNDIPELTSNPHSFVGVRRLINWENHQ